jgi:hypothetical protein
MGMQGATWLVMEILLRFGKFPHSSATIVNAIANRYRSGGGNRLSLFSFTIPAASSSHSDASLTSAPTSTAVSSSSNATPTSTWTSLGCYNDSVAARTLSTPIYGNNEVMTIELCQNACKNGGYVLAGVEYSGECCMLSTFSLLVFSFISEAFLQSMV